MFSHEGIQIGEVLDGYKSYTIYVDDNGLFIVAKIYDDIETAKDVWDGIEAGEFNAFSISFEPLDTAQHIVDGVWEEVRKLNLLEVSVCQNPKNPLSRFKILSKSKNVKETTKGEKMAEEELKHKPKDDKSSNDKEVLKSKESNTEEEKSDETKTEDDTSDEQDSDENEMDNEDEMKDKSNDTKSEEKQDGGGLVGAIREELSRLQQLGEEISAEDLNSLAQLVTNLRTGQGKSYPLPEKANKSEDTDWHEVIVNCINDLYSKLDSKSVKSKSINKSSDEVSKLKAEVVKKSEEAEDAKKTAEETKAVAEKDREVLSEVQQSLKKVDETFTKFDERLKSLESQKDVKTKVSTEKLIEDYHPSNVRETKCSVEVIVEGED
jgi:HK97 family phage prohead protease